MSRLAARVLTGTALAIGAAVLLWLESHFLPGRVALAVITSIAVIAAWELDHMGAALGLAGLCVLAPLDEQPPETRLLLLYGATLGLTSLGHFSGSILFRRSPGATTLLSRFTSTALGVWLLPPLFTLLIVKETYGTTGLVVLVVLAKIGDNAGFFVGRALGRRHPFPRISPGKTVAGCAASLVAGIAAGTVLLPYTLGTPDPRGFLLGALLGGLVNVAAQAGDLSESWVKRRAGVKDASSLVGPAGGVLDVIDSLLLASPVALLSWAWIY